MASALKPTPFPHIPLAPQATVSTAFSFEEHFGSGDEHVIPRHQVAYFHLPSQEVLLTYWSRVNKQPTLSDEQRYEKQKTILLKIFNRELLSFSKSVNRISCTGTIDFALYANKNLFSMSSPDDSITLHVHHGTLTASMQCLCETMIQKRQRVFHLKPDQHLCITGLTKEQVMKIVSTADPKRKEGHFLAYLKSQIPTGYRMEISPLVVGYGFTPVTNHLALDVSHSEGATFTLTQTPPTVVKPEGKKQQLEQKE